MIAINEYIAFLDRKIATRLSLAVALIDEYTGKQPIGSVKVFIKDHNLKPIKNHSGYYLFLNLPDNEYKVRVKCEYYFNEETDKIKLPLPKPQDPVKITLKPKPTYPFTSGATLIRGLVQDSNGNSVSGAKVEVTRKEVSNKTTIKGEFVLYFKALSEDDIIIEDSKRFVKGNADATLHLKATHDSKTRIVDLKRVEEGKTTPLESPIVLS